MRVRPILFNGEMVRAILEGRKTQTRRAFYPEEGGWRLESPDGQKKVLGKITSPHPKKNRFGVFIQQKSAPGLFVRDLIPCQFGEPGDRLWVRETWFPMMLDWREAPCEVRYRADGDNTPYAKPWRPSIHMPRWASRIMLEITNVRVERLQDISEQDAKAEGFDIPPANGQGFKFKARHNFQFTWEKIYSNWDANPWVWVVEFKRINIAQQELAA